MIGSYWQDYDLVFTNEIGEPLTQYVYDKTWHQVLERAGLPEEKQKMRPYDARHTMATLLLLRRVPIKEGHSDTSITQNVYSHVLDSMQDQVAEELEQVILSGKSSNKP